MIEGERCILTEEVKTKQIKIMQGHSREKPCARVFLEVSKHGREGGSVKESYVRREGGSGNGAELTNRS